MPSVLSDHDKETVKRLVPKATNKIQAVAVARLYVVPPNRGRWTFTGLQGAAVLSNDLVGNTFWIKLVDISPANRGVIWDQEIYETFQYNQDRTFFHSFELEQCMAALSFMDEKEARQFKKKMDEREKNASKATKSTPFGSAAGGAQAVQVNGGGHKSHGLLGGLFGRNRNNSNPLPPQPAYVAPQPVYSSVPTGVGGSRPQSSGGIDLNDPALRPVLDELVQMGITEDQISQNADFIKGYIEEKQAEEMANSIASALLSTNSGRAALPPPPGPTAPRLTPDNTGSTSASRRGPPPAPPPSRRPAPGRAPSPPRGPSPVPARTPSPPRPIFRAPPPLADAGKFAVKDSPQPSPGRPHASSGAALANPGPPPPPRPPKEADEDIPGQAFKVPPPFTGQRQPNVPPPPPSRGPIPPPPPSRDTSAPVPPPPPSRASVPPPPPSRANAAPIPPPPPPTTSRPMPPPPTSSGPPPPPPLPPMNNAPLPPPLPTMGAGGPPPPPPPMPPTGSGPPPPPGSANPPPLPNVGGGGRDDLMAAIRGGSAGGLRKVKAGEKSDRSAATVPDAESSSSGAPAGAPAAPSGDTGGLAGALQAALNQRKKKVSGSDDEKDDDDDW